MVLMYLLSKKKEEKKTDYRLPERRSRAMSSLVYLEDTAVVYNL